MIEEIKVGQEEVLFARHNGKLVYPKYASSENLVLHYDFSGRTNLDVQKGIAEDLSGNGNNGVFKNFAYTNESGYLDNALIFDGIDDFITIPKPLIDLNNFTYSEGGEVLSFRGNEVARVVDGVVEIGGRNLILNSLKGINVFSNNGKLMPMQDQAVSGENYRRFKRTYKEGITSTEISTYTNYFFTPEKSGYYTGSYYFRPNEFDIQLRLSFYPLLVPYTLCKANEWTQISVTTWIEAGVATRSPSVYGNMPPEAVQWIDYNRVSVTSGNEATGWSPAPKDLETTTFKPLFDKKIKSALYWNRALTDEELLQVYNTQIKRT